MLKYILFLSLIVIPVAWRTSSLATVEYTASIQASEEYNDNVNETNRPKSDFITVFTPNVGLRYDGGRLTASATYGCDFRIYDTGQRQNEANNSLEARAALSVIDKVLVVDVTDSNHMVFNNSALGQPASADSTRNQVNQNVFSAGATFTPNIAERTKTSLGYRVSGTVYGDPNDVNKYTHVVTLDVLHELTPRVEAGGTLQAQRQTTDQGDLTRYMASVVTRYTYGDGCFIFGRLGASDTAYDIGKNDIYPLWSAGLTHTWGKTSLILETQGDYSENPSTVYNSFRATYTAAVVYQFRRGTASVNAGYSDYSGRGTQHSKDFTTGLQVTYELTPRLAFSASGSRVNTSSSLEELNRWYGSAELRYQLPKDFSVRLYYNHKLSDSSTVNTARYDVNIVGLGLSKTF